MFFCFLYPRKKYIYIGSNAPQIAQWSGPQPGSRESWFDSHGVPGDPPSGAKCIYFRCTLIDLDVYLMDVYFGGPNRSLDNRTGSHYTQNAGHNLRSLGPHTRPNSGKYKKYHKQNSITKKTKNKKKKHGPRAFPGGSPKNCKRLISSLPQGGPLQVLKE